MYCQIVSLTNIKHYKYLIPVSQKQNDNWYCWPVHSSEYCWAVLSLVSREVSILRLCLTSCGSYFLSVSSSMADTKEWVFLDNAAFSWTPKKPAHRHAHGGCCWIGLGLTFIKCSFNDLINMASVTTLVDSSTSELARFLLRQLEIF